MKTLVIKYEDIGRAPARRLLFTFMESDNLSDLRRKIGLHEQTLTLWYSSLMYGSLRRLENGQEAMDARISDLTKELIAWHAKGDELLAKQDKLAARKLIIAALKNSHEPVPNRHHRRREDFASLDDESLKAVLRKAGVPEAQVKANLGFAKDYVRAPKEEQQEESLHPGRYSRPDRKSSRRSSRKEMEIEIKQKEAEVKQKEKKVKQKESEVSTQIRETVAAMNKSEPSPEERGRHGHRDTTSSYHIPVNVEKIGDENVKPPRPMSKASPIQRVQLDQFDPKVLKEYDIRWEPDRTDERYIILKQELSPEMIKILYQETKIRRAAQAAEHAHRGAEEIPTRPGRASSASVYLDHETSYLKPNPDGLRRRASDAKAGPRPHSVDYGVSPFYDSDSRSSMSSYGGDHDLFIRRDSPRPGHRRSRPGSYGGPAKDLFGETKPENFVPPPPIPRPRDFFDRRNPEIFITPHSPSSSWNESTSRTRPPPRHSASEGYFDESRHENIIELNRSKSSERSYNAPAYDSRNSTDTHLKRSSSARRPGDGSIRLIRKMDRIDSMDVHD